MRYSQHSRHEEAGGIGMVGIAVAVAAFGLGYYLGLRRFGEAAIGDRIGRQSRGGQDRDQLDSYRGASHIGEDWTSGGRTGAGTPPAAEVLIGDPLSHKSARDSAAVLYDQDGRPMRREQATAAQTG
jgi:hypothetical protein